MVNFRRIPSIFVTRPLAYVGRMFLRKPITQPDGDRRNKDSIYYPKEIAKKGEALVDRDLSLPIFKHTPHISPNFRGLLCLDIMKCTGCSACERVCPNKCIEMKTVDPQPLHWEKKRPLQFPMMYTGRCMYCNLCSQACPYDCLFHTPFFDAASSKNEDLYHDEHVLYQLYKDAFPERYEKELKEYIEKWGKPVEENVAKPGDIVSEEAPVAEAQEG
ncbi:MAG: 4Fe-4S dicluster domain-containing protein [Candidatus Heimdallarchaeota archaeon]